MKGSLWLFGYIILEEINNFFGLIRDEAREGQTEEESRYDRRNHLPVCTEKWSRCELEKCDSVSPVICDKCKVHLCLDKHKNCFKEYHIKG